MSNLARFCTLASSRRWPSCPRLPSGDRWLGSGFVAALLLFGAACSSDGPGAANTAGAANAAGAAAVGGTNSGQGGSGVGGITTLIGGTGPSGGASAGSSVGGTLGNGGNNLAGSSGSAVAGGSASGSGGGGGGNGACPGKTYKLCEDFESGASGELPLGWTKFKGYGAGAASDVGLATEEFHSGKSALKSSSMATGQTRAQTSLAALGATASKHWGRIYYKVQSPATKPASGVLHVTFVGLMGTGENRVVDTVEDAQGAHQWLYNNPDDNGGKGSAYDWSFDAAWHCAEWYVDVGAKAYRFFSDSKEVTSIGFTGKDDAQMSSYSSIIVGAEFYQMPPAPFVMWFDDLAIDDNQIGCQ